MERAGSGKHIKEKRRRIEKNWYRYSALFLLIISSLAVDYSRDNDFSFSRPPETNMVAQIADGVTISRERRLDPRPLMIHTAMVDMRGKEIIYDTNSPEESWEASAQTVLEFLEENDVILAFNSSFFKPFESGFGGIGGYPQRGDGIDIKGQVLSDGIQISEPEEGYSVLCVSDGGGLEMFDYKCPEGTMESIAGKNVLVRNGEIVVENRNGNLHPRTAFGVIGKDNTTLLIVEVDGRQPGYSEGVTLRELAEILLELGAKQAVNGDGGGSTGYGYKSPNGDRMIGNSPVHDFPIHGRLRQVFPAGIR